MSDLVEDHIVPLFHFIAQAGVPGEHIGFYHGAVKKTELDHVKNNKRVVLATYAMCSEGTNAPHWDTLVLATPRSNVKQAIGRVIRLVQGKRQPVVLDLVDDNSVLKAFYYSRVKQYFSVGGELVDV
jgi:superfamily II DNA or RNA helicase